MAFGGYDGSIRIDSKIDTKGFNAGIKSMTASLKPLALAIGAAFGVRQLALFGKSAVGAASDLASAMTGLKSILDGTGKSFDEGKAFIDDYISDGLIPATNAINAYKNLALRGYDTTQINKTLIALKDSAAFGRQSSLSLGQAVESASEGLRNENSILVDNAGVTKNVAVLWKEYAESIGTTANNLTKQQKIQAEVNGILTETRFQVGDAAKLTGGYAGLVASLGTSFYNLKVAVGNAIIPLLSAIIPVVKTVVDGLTVFVNQIAQIVQALFGIKPNVEQATEGADALAESTEKVEKAAKGALAAFDQINVLDTSGKQSDTPQAAAIDTAPIAAGLDDTANRFEAFADRLKEIFAPLKEAVFGVVAAGVTVLEAALEALRPVAEWLWNNFLKPLGEWAYQALLDGLQWLADRLNDIGTWINDHQTAFQDIVIVLGAFAAAWALVSTAMAVYTAVTTAAAIVTAILTSPILLVVLAIGAIIAVIVLLIRHWDEVSDFAKRAWEKIKEVWSKVAQWFNDKVLEPLGRWFSGAWDDIKDFASDAWNYIKDVWDNVKDWFNDNVITPLSNFFRNAWADITLWIENAWDYVKDVWNGVKDWFSANVLTPVGDAFSSVWDTISGLISDVWDAIKSIWQGAPGFFSDIAGRIRSAFDDAVAWIRVAWNNVFLGIVQFVRGQINAIITLVNGMISAVIGGVNAVIRAVNSLAIDVPGIPYTGFGGYRFSANIPTVVAPSIPYLAQGAVIPPNAAFAAVLGDQRSGRNLEAPEGLIRQIVREEAGQGGSREVTIKFAGSMAEFVRQLKPYIDKENRRVGGNLIKGVTP